MTITTSLSPNTETDDILLAFKTFLQPWKWHKGNATKQLEITFAKGKSGGILSFSCGRSALYALLKNLKLNNTDEVLLQAYTCVAVPAPILWANGKPIYVDIDPNTLNMCPQDLEKKITKNSKILIIQHTFGNPADINTLLKIAKKYKLFVIEDCAHTIGGMYQNKPLGSFGDASIFSFGRDKALSSIFGGLLTLKDPKLLKKITTFRDTNYQKAPLSWIAQQLIHPLIFSIAKPLYDTAKIGKIIIEISKRLKLFSKAVLPMERQGKKPAFIAYKMPNALAILALHQFKKIDRYNKHRQNICDIYSQHFPFPLTDHRSPITSPLLRFPVFVNHPQSIIKTLAKKHHIYLGDWYQQGIAPDNVTYTSINYTPKNCPHAETIAQKTLNLPTHIGITTQDAKKIIQHL